MVHFSVFDVGVVVVLAVSLFLGLTRGLTLEIFIFLAWVGAALVTVVALPYAAAGASAVIPWPAVASVLAMVAVFCLTIWLLLRLSKLISNKIKSSFFGPMDRMLGAFFGLARGAFIVSLLYLALAFFMPSTQAWSWVAEARLRAPVAKGAEWVAGLAPSLFATAQQTIADIGGITPADTVTKLKRLLSENSLSTMVGTYTDTAREELDELIEDATEDNSAS